MRPGGCHWPRAKRPATHGNKGHVASLTVSVDCLGDKFFACPAFPCDQYGRVGWRNPFDQFKDLLHGIASADDFVKMVLLLQSFSKQYILQDQFLVLYDFFYLHLDFVGIERFNKIIKRPFFHGLYGRVHGGIGGHHKDFRILDDLL